MSFEITKTYYDPSQRSDNKDKPAFELLPEGKHQASILLVTRKFQDKEINSRSKKGIKHIADLLEATYKIHEENPEGFAGRRIWSNAIWVWKDTNHIKTLGYDSSTHQSNDGGNERYAKFLEIAGYTITKETVEVPDAEGKLQKREVVSLPIEIDLEECIGMTCIIDIKNRKYLDKEDKEKETQNECGLYKWQPKNDDLPF